MPRTRDTRYDARAAQLIRQAANTPSWLIFRHPGDYDDRLVLQRAIYYVCNNPAGPTILGNNASMTIEWKHPDDGHWEKLMTPRGGGTNRGTQVGRLRVYTKAEARKRVHEQIKAGKAAYNTLKEA